MICQFTKKYIIEQSQKRNVTIPSNFEEILNVYCRLVNTHGYTLKFKKGRGLRFDSLSANAGFFKHSSIVATPEWAFQLVANNQESHTTFLMTLGHELTHKEDPPCFLCFFNLKFCSWANEVHADFGSAQKIFNYSRETLLDSIDYKLRYKKEYQKGDIEDYTHPSWVRRKYYIENFDFNSNLIQQIAKDVRCTNQRLINKMCRFYNEIKLC